MIDPLPNTVADALGDLAASDLSAWVARSVDERTIGTEHWRETQERMASQTRWAVGMLGLMGIMVTMLWTIDQLGIALR